VPDDSTRAALQAALERLRADVLLHGASLADDSPAKAAMIRTLDEISEYIDGNPDWFDEVFTDLRPQQMARDERGDH
jgi:hypothetical protein